MLEEIKKCNRCHQVISNIYEADYFSHISIKYCDVCRKIVTREKTAERCAKLRERKKQKDKYRDEELKLLKEKCELLQAEIEFMKSKYSKLRDEERGNDNE